MIQKRRHQLEPISYDELMSNAGMSGFVSFLEHPSPIQAVPATQVEEDAVMGPVSATGAMPQPFPIGRPVTQPPVARRSRIRKATLVEDGHSLAEQAVYEVLWKASSPVGEMVNADRTIRIGYHRLAQMTRLSWVSVKANLRTLEKKLAIEVTDSENSATREGKRYLVYSRPAILERRKRAGLEWVRRTRGVELLSQASIALRPSRSGEQGPTPVV